MRFALALGATLAVGPLAACSGSLGAPGSVPNTVGSQSSIRNGHFSPVWSKFASLIPLGAQADRRRTVLKELTTKPDEKSKGGIYVSQIGSTSIYGYPNPNSGNNPPTCGVRGVSEVNDVAVDGKGNLIDPDGGTRSVIIFKGPGMCGRELGSFSDPYGQPSDAASANAATGTIIVGNIYDNSGAGSISVCTLKGCTANLTNSAMYELAGVALAKNGDCWASAVNYSGDATLTYFKGCTGSGRHATGFENPYYGGLDIDEKGDLVSISTFDSELYVYKGCNPRCTVVGGPFSMIEEAVYGHLDKKAKNFVTGALDEVDAYKYKPRGLTYSYSFNYDLNYGVEGVAFNPRSEE